MNESIWKKYEKQPVIGITGNERPFPDDPDANMSYAATGFVEAVKEAGGIPFDLANWRCGLGQRLHIND